MKYYSNAQCLLLAVGRQLNQVLALSFYCDKNLIFRSVQEIYLEFEGLSSVRVFCGVDGSSICWDNSNLQPLSMSEYGELKVCNISNYNELWQPLIHKKLEKFYLVISEIEKCIFASKFVFSSCLQLVIANIGDDLIFQKQLSSEIIDEEKARFQDIALINDS